MMLLSTAAAVAFLTAPAHAGSAGAADSSKANSGSRIVASTNVTRSDVGALAYTTEGSFGPNEDWTSGPFFGSRGQFFADVNGDGRADAIVVNDDSVYVRP